MKRTPILSRRNLVIGAGSVGAAFLLGLSGVRLGTPSPDRMKTFIAKIVWHYLPDIQISEAAIQQFAGDFVSHASPRLLRNRLVTLLARLPYGTSKQAFSALGGRNAERSLEQIESNVLTKFMLSTGYFETDEVERPRLAYKGLHDPYRLGCGNPLARPVDT